MAAPQGTGMMGPYADTETARTPTTGPAVATADRFRATVTSLEAVASTSPGWVGDIPPR